MGRDIKNGEELTFDYQFQRYGEEKHPCLCGEANCRKFLGGKANQSNGQKKQNSLNTKAVSIIYREMNQKIYLRRHAFYLKHLLNFNHNQTMNDCLLNEQITKGIICNTLQTKWRPNHNVDSDVAFNVKETMQFENILFNLNDMNDVDDIEQNDNFMLHALYGKCIPNDEELRVPPIPIINNNKQETKNEKKEIEHFRIPKKNDKIYIKNVGNSNKKKKKNKKLEKCQYQKETMMIQQKALKTLLGNSEPTLQTVSSILPSRSPLSLTTPSDSPASPTSVNLKKRQRSETDTDSIKMTTPKRQKMSHSKRKRKIESDDDDDSSNTESESESQSDGQKKHSSSKHRNRHHHKSRNHHSHRHRHRHRHSRHSRHKYEKRNRHKHHSHYREKDEVYHRNNHWQGHRQNNGYYHNHHHQQQFNNEQQNGYFRNNHHWNKPRFPHKNNYYHRKYDFHSKPPFRKNNQKPKWVNGRIVRAFDNQNYEKRHWKDNTNAFGEHGNAQPISC